VIHQIVIPNNCCNQRCKLTAGLVHVGILVMVAASERYFLFQQILQNTGGFRVHLLQYDEFILSDPDNLPCRNFRQLDLILDMGIHNLSNLFFGQFDPLSINADVIHVFSSSL